MADRYSFNSQQRVIPCHNDSGTEIPPFACVLVTDMSEAGVAEVDEPDENLPLLHGFNGHLPIAIGGHGEITFDLPTKALYTGSAPANGDRLLIVSGQFELELDPDETEGTFIALGAGAGGEVYVQSLRCEC